MDSINKVAIVTGGGTGIGRSIALALGQQGYRIVLNYNNSAQAAQDVVNLIQSNGSQAIAVQANVSSVESCQNLVNMALTTFGRLDVVVNNAGITADNLLMRMSEDQFDQVIETNLKGVWNMAKVAIRPLIKNGSGRIINIASVSGLLGLAGQTNYSAAKAGVIGLTKALAREVASRHITVNAISPGYIQTAMTAKLDSQIQQAALTMIPLGEFGSPEDIANAVVFLASEQARYITGQTLAVDGGMSMH